eukprot:TRINITY_DN6623_c0_g1_i1.p1 TRINITY_DN6623_c0_g1~~TRINITY_DN6623_c0_g1_i1.p1  ORF type:complete len:516 (-),score=64.98 TRINITY_DN6623_c0_g1_i1:16-1563(-)
MIKLITDEKHVRFHDASLSQLVQPPRNQWDASQWDKRLRKAKQVLVFSRLVFLDAFLQTRSIPSTKDQTLHHVATEFVEGAKVDQTRALVESSSLMVLLCEVCELEAVSQCLDDGLLFCVAHGAQHMTRRPLHRVERGVSNQEMCESHPNDPYVYYCVEDGTPVCRTCDRLKHHRHKVVTLQEAVQSQTDQFKKAIADLGERHLEISEAVGECKDSRQLLERVSNIKRDIQVHYDELVELVRKGRDEALSKLEICVQACEKRLGETRQTAERMILLQQDLENVQHHPAKSLLALKESLKLLDECVVPCLDIGLKFSASVVSEVPFGVVGEDVLNMATMGSLFPPLDPSPSSPLSVDESTGLISYTPDKSIGKSTWLTLLPVFRSGVHRWQVELLQGDYLMLGVVLRDKVTRRSLYISEEKNDYSMRQHSCLWYMNIHAPGAYNYGSVGGTHLQTEAFSSPVGSAVTLQYDGGSQTFSVINPSTGNLLPIGTCISQGVSPAFEFFCPTKLRVKLLN